MGDGTIAIRSGEEINGAALRAWLSAAAPELVSADSRVEIRQYAAGFSNLTYEITLRGARSARRLVLRRPPRGVAKGVAHDMGREHGILAALHPLGIPVPRPLASCDDPSVIGAPFYLMEHVKGPILRGPPPASLVADRDALPGRMAALSRTFVETLVALHRVDVSHGPLAAFGRPDGYVERQVQGWTRRWQAACTHDVPDMDVVAAWLNTNRPADAGACLVHNDFKLDNLVLDPDLSSVRAILDWEMATVGDPLMDLGTSLAYWVEAGDAPIFRSMGLGITVLPGAYTRRGLVEAYGTASGRDIAAAPFYLTFGLFKVAVIAQQIHARFVQGLTADPRFSALGQVVEALARQAAATAAQG